MTRKDYTLIAEAFAAVLQHAEDHEYRPELKRHYRQALSDVLDTLAGRLKADNPRFDRERFMAAAFPNEFRGAA